MAAVSPEALKQALKSPMQFWDSRYGADEFAYGTEPNAWVRACVEKSWLPSDPIDIAELGAGEGRNAVYLAKCGHKLFTVDMSKEGVACKHFKRRWSVS